MNRKGTNRPRRDRAGGGLVLQGREVIEQPMEIAPGGGPDGPVQSGLELDLVEAAFGEVVRQPIGHLVPFGVGGPEVGIGRRAAPGVRVDGVPSVTHGMSSRIHSDSVGIGWWTGAVPPAISEGQRARSRASSSSATE